MSFLPGMFPAAAAVSSVPPSGLTFLTHEEDTANRTVYTFSNVAIGQPAEDRRIIVAAHSIQTSEKAISSITIGGVSATIHLNLNSASTTSDTDLVMASALVPDGTTADIVVTHNTDADLCVIGAWSLYGETSSSPHDTASDTSFSGFFLETSIDIPENGALIAAASAVNSGGASWSTTVEEDYNSRIFSLVISSGASADGLSAFPGRTVQALFNSEMGPSANTGLLGVISWQYA